MTAEVAILNRSAVALAADSAVTVGNERGAKVYNTVNKLFKLSDCHPVGVMIWGNADYMSIPWETVIKMYRQQRLERSLPTVEAYARDFLRFINRAFVISRDDERDRAVQIWVAYFDELNRRLRRVLAQAQTGAPKPLSQSDVDAIFLRLAQNLVRHLRQQGVVKEYSSVSMTRVRRSSADTTLP